MQQALALLSLKMRRVVKRMSGEATAKDSQVVRFGIS
jgi:hypothetical protein